MLSTNAERPRRLRSNPILRDLVSQATLTLNHLVQPYFLSEGAKDKSPIAGFTEVYRWGIELLSQKIENDLERGVKSFLLFGGASEKDKDRTGSAAYRNEGVIPEALRVLRNRFGTNALLFTDVCLCPYTDHGHCGIVHESKVINDASLEHLAKAALCHAQAGADFVAPSDMMDGRIGFLRSMLDQQGFTETGVLAYTAKYASSYYGPFREALASAPQGMDRSTYQMDFRNSQEALRELRLDAAEGADMVMVKPALAYLDIISAFRKNTDLPVVAYSVSGEYEMVKQMAAKGLAQERSLAIENLTAIRRAGADIVITYYASEMAEKGWLR